MSHYSTGLFLKVHSFHFRFLQGFIKCLSCSLYTRKTAPKCWKVNNFQWHLHILQYANEGSCKSQIARREKRRWREGAEWKRKKQTEAGVNYGCNLRFPRGKKKGREKPQVMHIRLRICHIFSSWLVSKLISNLPSVCVCVCVREEAFTHHPCQLV